MRHRQPSPFPFTTPRGDTIVNERCTCRHTRSRHKDTFTYGHGACVVPGCLCEKFTWAEWLIVTPLPREEQS